jgi:hypothetical protein
MARAKLVEKLADEAKPKVSLITACQLLALNPSTVHSLRVGINSELTALRCVDRECGLCKPSILAPGSIAPVCYCG